VRDEANRHRLKNHYQPLLFYDNRCASCSIPLFARMLCGFAFGRPRVVSRSSQHSKVLPHSSIERRRVSPRIYNQAVPPSYAQQARSFEQWSSTVACLSLLSKRVLHHCLIKRKLNIKNLLEFHLTCPIGAQSMWTLKREAARPAHMVYGTGQIER